MSIHLSKKVKRINNKEEFLGFMTTLEKYNFHWACGKKPTEGIHFSDWDFPIYIAFGSNSAPKSIVWWWGVK